MNIIGVVNCADKIYKTLNGTVIYVDNDVSGEMWLLVIFTQPDNCLQISTKLYVVNLHKFVDNELILDARN